jgi:Mg-chelatase subunit ChlI
MNPEEGDLRPQLLDRFALSVQIRGLSDPRDRVRIMEYNIAFESDPTKFREEFLDQERKLSETITRAREVLDEVSYTKRDLLSIAALTSSLEVDGHRADLVILKAARAHAAFEARQAINERDIALAAELALLHRLRRGPFQQVEIAIDDLQARIEEIQAQFAGEQSEPALGEEEPATKKKREAA